MLQKKYLMIVLGMMCLFLLSPLKAYGADYGETDDKGDIRLFSDERISFQAGDREKTVLSLVNVRWNQKVWACKWEADNEGLVVTPQSDGTCLVETNLNATGLTGTTVSCYYGDQRYEFYFSILTNEKRVRALNYFYRMGTIPWKAPTETMYYTRSLNRPSRFFFNPTAWYFGIPYTNRKTRGLADIAAFTEIGLDQDKVLQKVDDAYLGNDCSSAMIQAWNYGLYGHADQNFFQENQYYGYPSTMAFLLYKRAEGSGYATSVYLPAVLLKQLKDDSGVSLRSNLNQCRYDTRQITKSEDLVREGKFSGQTVGETVEAFYRKLKPGDGVLRYIFLGNKAIGHMMQVRKVTDEGIYFQDQHSLVTDKQTDGNGIIPGESTISTWHFYSYSSLLSKGYLPVKAAGMN